MIFVTVGTHEQPFDRLVQAIDSLKENSLIFQDVFIQKGYSNYKPRFCEYKDFLRFDDMLRYMADAEMIITHGGTGSIMQVLYLHKIPIVVPRQKKFNEHIDDHQVLFCQTLENKGKIIPVYNTNDLRDILENYASRTQATQSANSEKINRNLSHQTSNTGHSPAGTDTIDECSTISENARIFSKKLNDICLKLVNS